METVDETASAGFYQLKGTHNSFGHTLETVFCSKYDNVEIRSPAPALFVQLGYSHAHKPVELTLAMDTTVSSMPKSTDPNVFDFKRADYQRLMEDVQNIDWDLVLLPEDVN